ncbi:uncharacterized protein [Amphiura filiformis]|uniref:uncharacterized protein n=1 Tax=Amphiura filiformis TaxID=82378 RepID=UPI003B2156D1
MCFLSYLLRWLVILLQCVILVVSSIEVEINAPVNPVETGAIFSVHCQVRGLTNKHEVALYRTNVNGDTQRLSSKEEVDTEIDERVFLAVRRLMDGSEVYFLTITDFRREDVGNYSCKVIRTSPTIAEVGSHTILAELLFFPSTSDPQCSNSGDPITIMEGSILELNCSSELGNPTVEIGWSRAGNSYSSGASESIIGNRIYSHLTLVVSRKNRGDIFLCEIESIVEPYTSSCHAGPIHVILNPDADYTPEAPVLTTALSPTLKPSSPKNPTRAVASSCKDVCPSLQSVPKPWIISTIITGVVAIILLLVIVVVSAKYTGHVSAVNSAGCRYQRPPDEIYTELQYRKGDLMYVPTDKAKALMDHSRTELDAFDSSPYGES